MFRSQRLSRILKIAGKLLIAAPLEESLDTVTVWNIMKKDPGSTAWLWDRNGTGDFVKGGTQHFELAMEIVKKHKLSDTYEGLEEKAMELLDGSSVRGYFFPKENKIAVYPIKHGSRYVEAKDDSIYRTVAKKLESNAKTTGIAIQDEYYIPSY